MSRRLYDFLMAGSVAYARWDLEVSRDIIRSRRKLLLIGLLLLPILPVTLAEAAGTPILGGKSTYAPSFYSTEIFLVSIGIGLAAGLITGTIGAGGGFIITPALMAVGVKGIMAVGTDVFHIFPKAIMGAALHNRLGNVSFKLAFAFLAMITPVKSCTKIMAVVRYFVMLSMERTRWEEWTADCPIHQPHPCR
ncbi:MAG: TSUP family transporter [Rhodocyclaceae bacterium]|nr:TSUP family transporter [Rhodocyclaceae bacterium]